MKRLALALFLLAAPAWGGTYWVSPVGNAANDGGDSTKFRAKTLAWANANAVAGDTIYLKSSFGLETDTTGSGGIPQYDQPIKPTHSGTSNSARIWFIGDVNTPRSRVVTYVEIDTADGANKYISVYGIHAKKTAADNGNLVMRSECSTARYDSVAYCVFDAALNVYCRSYSTVAHCEFGTGLPWPRAPQSGVFQSSDKPHITGHYGGCPVYQNLVNGQLVNVSYDGTAIEDSTHGVGAWLTAFRLNNCTFNIGGDPGENNNAMTMRLVRGSTIDSNSFTLRRYGTSTNGTQSLFTYYYSHDNVWSDNTFTGYSEVLTGDFYLINLRDWHQRNRWYRNSFLEDLNSPGTLKVQLMTSGNDEYLPRANAQHVDPGSRRNLWDGNFFRTRGVVGYQSPSHADTLQFNTFLIQGVLNFGNTGTAMVDSLVFRHNTVVSFRQDGRSTNTERQVDSTSYSRFTKNIFASTSDLTTHYHHHIVQGRGNSVADSNLYFCSYEADSAEIKSDAHGLGPSSLINYCADIGRECASHFDDPEFADESWLTFDGYPGSTSIALSSNLWGTDGYVGARGPTSDTTDPTVTITSPVDNQLLALGASTPITWTCSDAVGVTRIDVDRGKVGLGGAVTWYTIKHNIAGSATSWFFVPTNTRYTHGQIRVTVYDAAGNSASDTVEYLQPCAPCNDDVPYYEVP